MGLLRLFLALSVIAGHAQATIFGFNGIGAWYAVNTFFIISGFYMAMVLNEKHKTTRPFSFYKSRALRLFPSYLIGVCFALVVSIKEILPFFEHLTLLSKFYYVFQNLFVFGQDFSYLLCAKSISLQCASPVDMTINPPAWSLAVELGFYLIAPFVLRSEKKTFYFIIFGCVYLLSLNGLNLPSDSINPFRTMDLSTLNYFFYPSSFIFFGGGAMSYHLSKRKNEPRYFAAIVLVTALSFTQTVMPFWHLIFISMSIPVLFNYTKNNRIDRFIGYLSYPAYILHFPLIVYIKPLTTTHPKLFNFIGFGTWVAIISCILGTLVYFTIEKRINVYRDSNKFLHQNESFTNRRIRFFYRSGLLGFFLLPVLVVAALYGSQMQSNRMNEPVAFDLTDENWTNGVSKSEAAFFVSNNSANRRLYREGRYIRFVNGEIRAIIKVDESDQFLNIYLDGSLLDGEIVGFPNIFEVLEGK